MWRTFAQNLLVWRYRFVFLRCLTLLVVSTRLLTRIDLLHWVILRILAFLVVRFVSFMYFCCWSCRWPLRRRFRFSCWFCTFVWRFLWLLALYFLVFFTLTLLRLLWPWWWFGYRLRFLPAWFDFFFNLKSLVRIY